MERNSKPELDRIGRRLLREVQLNARLSLAELGRRLGLTPPAVGERLRRLEDSHIIRGYHANLDTSVFGLPLLVFIRLTTTPQHYPAIIALLSAMPEVLECHHVAGAESFMIKVRAATTAHIEDVISRLSAYGSTATTIVLSSPIDRAAVAFNPDDAR